MDRIIFIYDELAKTSAKNLINNLPYGGLDVVIRPHKEVRTLSQNNLMWSSAINDVAEQAWFNGKQFSADVWHEYFKQMFMPETHDEDVSLKVKNVDTYVKWVDTPTGERKCVASTTNLTKKGFADYLEQVYAFGSELGVLFKEVTR